MVTVLFINMTKNKNDNPKTVIWMYWSISEASTQPTVPKHWRKAYTVTQKLDQGSEKQQKRKLLLLTGVDCEWSVDKVVCIFHRGVQHLPSHDTQCPPQCWTACVQSFQAPMACHPCTAEYIWISLKLLSSPACSRCVLSAFWSDPKCT